MKGFLVRTYKFRLYPTRQVACVMEQTLNSCRFLYNAELEYEQQIYFCERRYLNSRELNSLIPDWKVINPDLRLVHSQVLQNVSDRLAKTFIKFFEGEGKVGFPRFKSRDAYNSFTFPQSGFKVEGDELSLSKICVIYVKAHRNMKGRIKTLTVKKTYTNKWFACFTVIREKKVKKRQVRECLGIDLGLNYLYADSEGNMVCNPRWFRRSEEKLALAQKRHAKKQKGSNNQKRARLKIARVHELIVNQRNDFLHKESRRIADRYGYVAVEKLSIKNMVRNKYLSKSICDASWNKFLGFLAYKVEETGCQIIGIEAGNTSQYCICGHKVRKTLPTRIHKCGRCGKEVDRDLMSALLIRTLALDYCTVGTAGINACGDVQKNVCEARSRLSRRSAL